MARAIGSVKLRVLIAVGDGEAHEIGTAVVPATMKPTPRPGLRPDVAVDPDELREHLTAMIESRLTFLTEA